MEAKRVGDYDSLPGTLEGNPYDLFVMKDSGYTIKIMSTYGNSFVKEGQKELVQIYKNAAGPLLTIFLTLCR